MIERAHVMQAVGQLDQHDTDIVGHRQEHLAKALCLARGLTSGSVIIALAGPWYLA